jgi:hypothetical protein
MLENIKLMFYVIAFCVIAASLFTFLVTVLTAALLGFLIYYLVDTIKNIYFRKN